MAISTPTHLANTGAAGNQTSGQTSWAPSLVGIPDGAMAFLMFDNATTSGSGSQPTSVNDGTNDWTQIASVAAPASGADFTSIYYHYFASAPGTITLTVAFPSGNMTFGWVGYVTGTDPTPADQAGTGQSSLASSCSATTTGNLTADGELLLSVLSANGGSAITFTATQAGFSAMPTNGQQVNGARFRAANFAYQLLGGGTSGATATTGTCTWTPGSQYGCINIATFKPAVAGGAVTVSAAETVAVTDAAAAQAYAPTIQTTDIEYHASATGLGGAIDATLTSGSANNVWDDVTAGESTSGDVEYRCIYVKNAHPVTTWIAPKVWIDGSPTPDTAAIALDSAAVGSTAASTSANETTAPTGGGAPYTFTSPTTKATGLQIADIPAGQYKAIWIRRTVPSSSAANPADAMSVRCEGSTP